MGRTNYVPSYDNDIRQTNTLTVNGHKYSPPYYYVYFIITVNTYLFKYVPVKLGFIILSIIGVFRIPEEYYLYKDKKKQRSTR